MRKVFLLCALTSLVGCKPQMGEEEEGSEYEHMVMSEGEEEVLEGIIGDPQEIVLSEDQVIQIQERVQEEVPPAAPFD